MKKKPRILSIDFDYFQDTERDTVVKYYPDGIDLPYPLSSIVWTNVYAKSCPGYDDIQRVKINNDLLLIAEGVILCQNSNIPVIIKQSHLGIWEETKLRFDPDNGLYIAHVDFHHDFTNGYEEQGIVDCGNWLYFMTKIYKAKLRWYTRSVSLDCYKCSYDEMPAIRDDLLPLSMESDFDMIYICRSDAWIPPHLDCYFDRLVKLCEKKFSNIYVEDSVSKPRDMEEIYQCAKQIDDSYEEFMKGKK